MAPSGRTISGYSEKSCLGCKKLVFILNIPKVIKIFNSYTWSLTLKAVSHAVRETPISRPAMTLSHLGALLRACDTDKSMIPLKVALSFGYLGYLRVSNLAPNSEDSFNPTRSTTWGDIWPSRDGIIVALKWTKTRQTNMDRVTVPLPALGASEFCPLRIWRCYAREVSDLCLAPSDPLLLSTVHPRGRAITIPMLRMFLRRASQLAGLSACNYTPHSLRRGGASFSYSLGVSTDHIKLHGTWRSNTVDDYLHSLPQFATPVATAFVNSLSK